MKILMNEQLSPHKYKDNHGYLICTDCIMARTGKQTYTRDDCFGDGDMTEIEVDRKAEDVFDPKTLASFENVPITIEHPNGNVDPDNYNSLSVGYMRDIHKGIYEGQPVMLGTAVITDSEGIEKVESGELTNLSCGYDCDVDDTDHPHQSNIRGNHIALCEIPRAGITHIQDSRHRLIKDGDYDDLIKALSKDVSNVLTQTGVKNASNTKLDYNVNATDMSKGKQFSVLIQTYCPSKNSSIVNSYANDIYKKAKDKIIKAFEDNGFKVGNTRLVVDKKSFAIVVYCSLVKSPFAKQDSKPRHTIDLNSVDFYSPNPNGTYVRFTWYDNRGNTHTYTSNFITGYDGAEDFLPSEFDNVLHDIDLANSLFEEWAEMNGYEYWGKGKEGTHGTFKTKKLAREQQKAMFANGYRAKDSDYDKMEDNIPSIFKSFVRDIKLHAEVEGNEVEIQSGKNWVRLKRFTGIGDRESMMIEVDYERDVYSISISFENAPTDEEDESYDYHYDSWNKLLDFLCRNRTLDDWVGMPNDTVRWYKI